MTAITHALHPPRRWCVTGVAGFIGSHLLEYLLHADQWVSGLDNFSTGSRSNLDDVRKRVSPDQWARFRFVEGDITRGSDVAEVMDGAELVLHQAALGSVPQSIEDPAATHAANVTGTLQVLAAARAAKVGRVVYASSSAVYGDATDLPAREDNLGQPLSPYALSKRVGEQYAAVFDRCYGLPGLGLRYFNVFGPRQDPAGPYAAVIPRWIDALLRDRPVEVFGDGETSRDFCHVSNVVQANLLAATVPLTPETPRLFNIGLGGATSLNQLFAMLRHETTRIHPAAAAAEAVRRPFREGDVRRSRADIERAGRWLGYRPVKGVSAGLAETVDWFSARGSHS